MPLIRHAQPQDLPGILDIYNDAVLKTTAIWNETPVDLANRQSWYESRISSGQPILVAVREEHVLGYASYGPFRAFEGFRATGELSLYVSSRSRGHGIGRQLLQTLIVEAGERGLHVLVAGIEAGNTVSIRLHESLGFVESGRMPEVGQKFGRYLDLVLMQRQVG
ncbi:GNAT family N-acetyltransferase [Methylobrevis pamukkalensis]|uniref:N-acyltransferase YncA n=1 Tax=Methylobrevis pamukkalensis TaxID=1439726 RepID=A0A1E3H2H2_9HYPH|nr:GNAT family N-acetyltransferase [Methylobrevis pamukkalensis]ODN70494.1 N-acyltransferase YncA [Methylobrevis pamukkalensis]